MARTLGLSLAEVDALPHLEYMGWVDHLRRYPTFSMVAAHLLGTLKPQSESESQPDPEPAPAPDPEKARIDGLKALAAQYAAYHRSQDD